MERLSISPRNKWQGIVESQGMSYHTIDGSPYWDESACYRFTAAQIDTLENATQELHRISLQAVEEVIRRDRFDMFRIPREFAQLVTRSWEMEEPTLYGRFDLAYTGTGEPKLLEYNADTPTALLEASVIQWFWLQDVFPHADQFNSIHEKLIAFWQKWPHLAIDPVYFACAEGGLEDAGNVEYLMDTAYQARMKIRGITIEDIGWDPSSGCFVDLDDVQIRNLFKLYPWEWMVREEFGKHLLGAPVRLLEPAWKMILSNKAILALLWEMFEGHPNLLPASLEQGAIKDGYVKKPIFSREGENVTICAKGWTFETPGTYGDEGSIYQAYTPLPIFEGNHTVIGSWIVDGEAAGIGIREDVVPVTTNASRFIPHFFEEG